MFDVCLISDYKFFAILLERERENKKKFVLKWDKHHERNVVFNVTAYYTILH